MNYQRLIEQAKAKGISEIEIYAQHKSGLSIQLFESKVDKYVLSDTTGLAIRGLYNNKMGYVSIEKADDSSIDFIINKLIDNASTITSGDIQIIFEGSKDYENIAQPNVDFIEYNPQIKIDLLKQLEHKILSIDPRVTKVSHCSYQENVVKTTLINSKGLDLSKTEVYIFVYASAVAKDGEDVKSDGDYIITKHFDSINIDELANSVVNRAVSLLNASPVESKIYPVILKNDVFAEILKAFESMFSGESALKNLTLLKDKVGQKIVSEQITLVDDPLYKDSFTQCAFDDEGVACNSKEIISKGVFNTFLHNLKTATAFGVQSTGNGFRANVNAPINVSSCNMYIKNGSSSLEEMIASTMNGLLISNIAGIHAGVDPVSGNFSLQSSGFLIEQGQLKKPVTLIVIAGNFLDMLNKVELIGNDSVFTNDQIGAPSIKISGLTVSGK